MTTIQSTNGGINVGIPASTMNGLPSVSPNYVNPAHMSQPSANGPQKKKIATNAKRRRTDTPDEPAAQQRKNRDGPRKKKANRACCHCQKAHLTCDDSRPCQRCIKRGLADTCTEGHRKKAKYLLDEDELEQLKRSKSYATESSSEPSTAPPTSAEPFSPNDTLFNVPFDPNFSFGSEQAGLEYSILSAMLGNPSPPDSGPSPPSSQNQFPNGWGVTDALPQAQYGQSPVVGSNGYSSSYGDQPPMSIHSDAMSASPGNQMSPQFMEPYPPMPHYQQSSPQEPSGNQQQIQYAQQYTQPQQRQPNQVAQQPTTPHPLEPRFPREFYASPSPVGTSGPTVFGRSSSRDSISGALGSPALSNSSAPIHIAYADGTEARGSHSQRICVTRPFDYTEGYHFLMKHLPSRFEKNDILRIVRALAIFRPSLIALQMPLTEEDEIFVEKCFQRSLLELEKLISFSGTPTVVWRRTGEICLVAPEFCMLTGWSKDELMGRRKYIYELFENQSVVEYYENFAEHAFENTTQSVYSHCVLLKPCGAPIPATFCFSIRRDIYDLPSIVIGQWLPLL